MAIQEASSALNDEIRRTEDGTADVLATLINRVAAIDDELERRGANELLKERDALRDRIKDCMADIDTLNYFDEVSGYEAHITPTYSDIWNKDALIPALPRREMVDEALETVVNVERVKEWLRDGSLTRLSMERAGALVRKLRSRALKLGPKAGDRARRA